MLCPVCGTENLDDADECINCGMPLKTTEETTDQINNDPASAKQENEEQVSEKSPASPTADPDASNEPTSDMRSDPSVQHIKKPAPKNQPNAFVSFFKNITVSHKNKPPKHKHSKKGTAPVNNMNPSQRPVPHQRKKRSILDRKIKFSKRGFTYKEALFMLLVCLVFVALIVTVICLANQDRYERKSDSISFAYSKENDTTSVFYNEKLQSSVLNGSITNIKYGDNGDVAVCEMQTSGTVFSLVYVTKSGYVEITDSFCDDYVISTNGKSVSYVTYDTTGTGTIYLFNGKTSTAIFNGFTDIDSQVISPNGKNVLFTYAKPDGDVTILYCSAWYKNEITDIRKNVKSIGITDSGLTYCLSSDSIVYSQQLGTDNSISVSENVLSYSFNKDLSQAVLVTGTDETKTTCVSKKGNPAVQIMSVAGDLIMPAKSVSGSSSGTEVYGINSFFNAAYYDSDDKRIYYVDGSGTEYKLVSDTASYQLTYNGKTLYLGNESVISKVNVGKSSVKIDIASDVDGTWVVTSNGSYVYYMSEGSLFCVSGSGNNPHKVSDGVSSLKMSGNDIAFFIYGYNADNHIGELYAAKSGKIINKAVAADVFEIIIGTKAVYFKSGYDTSDGSYAISASSGNVSFNKMIINNILKFYSPDNTTGETSVISDSDTSSTGDEEPSTETTSESTATETSAS